MYPSGFCFHWLSIVWFCKCLGYAATKQSTIKAIALKTFHSGGWRRRYVCSSATVVADSHIESLQVVVPCISSKVAAASAPPCCRCKTLPSPSPPAAVALPVGRKLGRGRNEFRMCRNLPSQSAVLCLCLIRHSFHDITTNWRRRPKIHAKSIRFYRSAMP